MSDDLQQRGLPDGGVGPEPVWAFGDRHVEGVASRERSSGSGNAFRVWTLLAGLVVLVLLVWLLLV